RGYCIEGSLGSNCQASGKWSSEPPRCNRVKCKKPSKPKFGQISVNTTDIFVDFIATYQCNNGYDINGNSSLHKHERICMQNETINHCDGKWSNKQPVCKPKLCPTALKQNNRTILGKLYEYPHSITIGCDDGYELHGGSSVWNCSDRGTWIDTITKKSGDLPSCEPKDCKKPIVSESCGLNGTYYKYPGVVNFTRLHGYCVDGDKSITCKSDGKWSSQSPSCKRITCQKISRPRNGSINRKILGERINPFVNSTVAFSCNEGYDLNGNESLSIINVSCLQQDDISDCNGRWSNTTPCCIPRSCPNPSRSNFKNGTIIGDAFFFPETINLTCNEGHELIGGTSVFKCNEKGNWVEVKMPRQETKNAVRVRIGNQRRYINKCKENQMHVRKTNKGANLHFPTCKPKNCNIPKLKPHCNRIGIYFQYKGVVEYGRDYGYCIVGPNKTQSRSCSDPNNPNFTHGIIEGKAYFYPETIFLNCSKGHEIVGGRSYFQCNQTGQWHEISKPSDEAAQQANERINSEPKDCGKPFVASNCTLVSTIFHYPHKVMFARNYGYCVVGSNISQCNSQGLWSKASPTCEQIQCPPLSDPEHGTVQLSSEQRFVNDTAVYSCHSGYDLNMDKKIQIFTRICLQHDNPHECKGTWSEKQPCCIPRSCPDPNNPNFTHGIIEGKAYFYPETIFLNCSEGHEIVGGRSYFQCNQTGQWHEISKPSDEAAQQANERINSEREKVKSCVWPKSNSIKTRHFPTNIRQFPTCQPKDCGKPFVASNCTLVSTIFHYPHKVMFARNYGYCVVGSNISQCNSQGLWSKASPSCERKI
ncbi:sushi, von Willebrand factor type A, EGF and pentraxin domain-containing protein 1-like, partial [Corticium candelabrum]|uniref:sushi, von Willebrand factor type A, EGF and pentraxin domain-containing protein 1-like n=1 Tax=Corticium candelabrum TaxID=121492 RepID=UPI002E2633EB